jgi:hypothetical protein
VFSRDIKRAKAVARRLEAGTVTITTCAQQSLLISRFHLRHDIHMHPCSARKTRMLGWLLRLVYGRERRH